MKIFLICLLFLLPNEYVAYYNVDLDNIYFLNRTTPTDRQLYEFKLEHTEPIGVLTTSSGFPVDIRDTISINKNQFINDYNVDLLLHSVNEKIPDRIVQPKGIGVWGYFIVDNANITKYTSADLFSEVGKKTPVFGRFSVGTQNLGGTDVEEDFKGLSVKLYTEEGNLDFLCLHTPVYFYRNSLDFVNFIRAFHRNPKTNIFDYTARWDFVTRQPELLSAMFWFLSDFGIPNGYRKTDYFPIHAYELQNKHGERFFVKFNFRTHQGLENLNRRDARILRGTDPNYFTRDLYDAIEEKNYPVFTLELYIIPYKDIRKLNYDPFDVTRLWQKGTYDVITVGRFIFNENIDNWYRTVSLSAFSPANLVPGIPGPIDSMFRGRRINYRDAHNHRLGVNHNRIPINAPLYRKVYNRDGYSPVAENMRDAPSYYPNSFDGPVPYVNINRPKDSISTLHTKAVDLEEPANFYNNILTSEQRDRFIDNTVMTLLPIAPYLQDRVLKLFTLVDARLGHTLTMRLTEAEENPGDPPPRVYRASRKNIYFLNRKTHHEFY